MDRWSSLVDWAEAYIRAQDSYEDLDESHPDRQAIYEFMVELTGNVAEECWAGILEVVKRRPSEKVLGMVGAGLLEDLLDGSGPQFIERIELQARMDPVFRRMLHSAWEIGPPEVWARVELARGTPENAA